MEEEIEDINDAEVGYACEYENESSHIYQDVEHYYTRTEIEEFKSSVENRMIM